MGKRIAFCAWPGHESRSIDTDISEAMLLQTVPRCKMDDGLNGKHLPQSGRSAVRNRIFR